MPTEPRLTPQPDRPSRLSRLARRGCVSLLTLLILEGLSLLPWGGGPHPARPVGQSAPASPTLPPYVTGTSISLRTTPSGSADWPGYTPSDLYVPAHSLVRVTIRNYDLGDPPLPTALPYAAVQGIQGSATADGRPYVALNPARVAHTFTIPALHLSVPIPADAAPGAAFVTVSFTFRTGGPGVYRWQCFAPCGDGPEGVSGPMDSMGDMMGTLIVGG